MSGARRTAAVLLTCGLLLAGVACGTGDPADDAGPTRDLPTQPLGPDGMSTTYTTVADLARDSYVVARGRFVGGPRVLTSTDDEELPTQVVVWEFVPDEVYRDVRRPDAPARRAEEGRGSILVAAGVNRVGEMRQGEPIADFVTSFPSRYNLNTLPLDRPVYVFLRPGAVPREAVQRDPDLAHVMTLTGTTHCYLADDLRRSCLSVADVPGGAALALPEDGGLVPADLAPEAIQAAGAVPEVISAAVEEPDPSIDTERYAVLPGSGGEG